MRIPLTEPHDAIAILGAPEVAYAAQGTRIYRILQRYHTLMPVELTDGCNMASGTRLSFRTNASRLTLALETLPSGLTGIVPARLDVLANEQRVLNHELQPLGLQEVSVQSLEPMLKRVDIYLPQTAPVRLFHLDLEAGATLLPVTESDPVWITYGSSITHCGDSDGPSTTWPALVARKLRLNLFNLGFGSNGMMDACAARTIAQLPAHRISLKLACNTLTGTYNQRGFVSAALNMILTIRDRQPDTPLLIISPICFPNGESTPNVVGINLQRMRELDHEIVQRMRNFGDPHISYLSGLDIFGPADAHLLDPVAHIHPNAEAQYLMANRFVAATRDFFATGN